MAEVTKQGETLIKNWLRAQESVKTAKRELNSEECVESNAEKELGKWLMPNDMKIGEKIAVWMGDSLFQVELLSYGPKVSIRTRGKHMDSLRVA